MIDRLKPCEACRRHIAPSETACPFCGALVPPRPQQAGLAGAAIVAALATAGCGGGTPKANPSPDPPMQTVDAGVPADAGPPAEKEDEAARREREEMERERRLRERKRRDDRLKMPYGAPQARRRLV